MKLGKTRTHGLSTKGYTDALQESKHSGKCMNIYRQFSAQGEDPVSSARSRPRHADIADIADAMRIGEAQSVARPATVHGSHRDAHATLPYVTVGASGVRHCWGKSTADGLAAMLGARLPDRARGPMSSCASPKRKHVGIWDLEKSVFCNCGDTPISEKGSKH